MVSMTKILCLAALGWLLPGALVAASSGGVSIPLEVIFRHSDCPRGLLPVTTTVFFEEEAAIDPAATGWLLEYKTAAGQWKAWPSQVERWRRTGGTAGQKPAWTGQLSFFPPEGTEVRVSFRLRQTGADEARPKPDGERAKFRLNREKADWVIENKSIRFHLHGDGKKGSGQLASVTLLTGNGEKKLETASGPAIHRNPDINVLGRPWAHSHKWNPPDQTVAQEGPLVIEIVRSGVFPGVPEADLRIRYRFFADRNFMESFTEVELREDLSVIALRNDQLIFAPDSFTDFAWREKTGIERARFADHKADNPHGDIMKLWPETPWVLFWNDDTGVAAGTVRVKQFNSGPGFSTPVNFEESTYLMNLEGVRQSWMRPQTYLSISWSREAGLHLPAGSRFSEVNLYCFSADRHPPADGLVEQLYREIQCPPLVQLGSGPFAPLPAR
jgi:hypothetical protein